MNYLVYYFRSNWFQPNSTLSASTKIWLNLVDLASIEIRFDLIWPSWSQLNSVESVPTKFWSRQPRPFFIMTNEKFHNWWNFNFLIFWMNFKLYYFSFLKYVLKIHQFQFPYPNKSFYFKEIQILQINELLS